MPETATLTVQTPDGHLAFEGLDALHVCLSDGWASFFPNHAAFLALVVPGVARVEQHGTEQRLAHGHGVLRVGGGVFHLLCGAAGAMTVGQSFDTVIGASAALARETAQARRQRELQLEAALWRVLEHRVGADR